MDAPAWPPSLSPSDQHTLLDLASDYALSHGLVVRPFPSDPADPSSISHTSAIHAPYALYPSPFPRDLFDQARELQPLYNELYARVTGDDEFLEEVVGGAVAKVDEFQGRLYEIWKAVKKEGVRQPLSLGLFRSDYLLHSPPSSPSSLSIKQVEFNTISSSFGVLSTRVTALHRYLLLSGAYPSDPRLSLPSLPENGALEGLAAGLAAAHKAYGREEAVVLMVTQDNERNAFDQRPLEYELIEKHGIRTIRLPLSVLSPLLSLAPPTSPSSPFPEHALLLTLPTSTVPIEISLVYYRTAYAPTDYTPSSSRDWDTRLLVERSLAVKCPSVAMQLAGSKKVQQVLSDPAQLARFFPSSEPGASAAMGKLRTSFTDLYPLDDSPLGAEALRLAQTEPERFVLKPQREGGGNNIYRADIPPFLAKLAAEDEAKPAGEAKGREGYILMSLIEPPRGREQVLVKAGERDGRRAEVVSELGVYGVVLLREGEKRGDKPDVLVNETVGHLLRTKDTTSDEGGVAVGFSVIDSPLLVEA
ncbi:hypothetical protein JCM6882_005857 [Rhodosporidiobolus microsporus]